MIISIQVLVYNFVVIYPKSPIARDKIVVETLQIKRSKILLRRALSMPILERGKILNAHANTPPRKEDPKRKPSKNPCRGEFDLEMSTTKPAKDTIANGHRETYVNAIAEKIPNNSATNFLLGRESICIQ